MSKQKDYYWTTKDGRKLNLDDMDENHLRNCLKLIIRNKETKEKQFDILEEAMCGLDPYFYKY